MTYSQDVREQWGWVGQFSPIELFILAFFFSGIVYHSFHSRLWHYHLRITHISGIFSINLLGSSFYCMPHPLCICSYGILPGMTLFILS